MMPRPATTTGMPAAAMLAGVTDTNTGLIASTMHASHVTSGVARFAHTALAFRVASTLLLPLPSKPAARAAAAFQPMQTAASVRPAAQATAAHGRPPTAAVASRGPLPTTHNDTPLSVRFTSGATGDSSWAMS